MNRIGKLMTLMLGLWAGAAVAATASSNVFKLDFRTGDRVSAGTEELTFSNLWDGDADATVTIAQDGAAIFTGLTGEGAKPWTVDRNGRYVLTHTTYTNGVAGKVETAVFVVEGKEVPVRELTVEWEAGSYMYDNTGKTPGVMAKNGDQVLEKGVDYTVHYEGNTNAGTAKAILTGLPPYVGSVTNEFAIAKRVVELTSGSASKPYDGTPLVCHSVTTNGDGFVTGEGVDLAFTGSQTIAGSSKNTFDYTFKTGTLEGNYTITKAEGDLEVTSGEIVNPFDPDDPSKPVTPEVLAKANCITNYDGEGHAIDIASLLNPLVADCLMAIEYALDPANEPFAAENPTFTNVVTTSVWYRITSSNFKPFTTNAVLTISPRSIANVAVAAIADQTYSGSGIEPMPVVTDMRTLAGNSDPTDILTSADYDLSYLNNTNVGTAKVVLLGKSNYEGALTNTFQIVPAIIPPGPSGAIAATGYTNAYDGAAHGVSVSVAGLKTQPTVQYKSSPSAEWQDESPTYADVCDTQVWWKVSAPNYQSVEGMIGLKIAQAENAWTVEPAIEGWTYGTAAKTPVGAAKFGEVAFTYSPATVGPAGDYTLTASVSGTANYTGLSKTVGFTITKATLPPDVTPDPVTPDPANPGGPYSTFDYVGVYDGAGHTIDTNGLSAAFKGVVGDGFAVSYAVGESGGLGQLATPWSAVAPVFTNAATNVVWYKVSSANYADIVHAATVAIVPRAITVASVGGTWTYDTVAHGTNEVKVALSTSGQETASPFPEGEGIEVDASSFPTITDVGEKDNTFEWAFAEGTLAGNYAVTVRYGKLKVEPRTIGDDPANWDIRLDKAPTYNGEVQSAPIIQVCYVKPDGNLDYIPYTLAGNTATDAGNYKVRISGTGNYTGTVEKDWAIMPRNVTLKSGTAVWEYDGATHVTNVVEVTGDGFVDGEGATYSDFPQVTHVADAATPLENAFTYTLNENTKAQNYVINVVKGTVTMTKRPITLTAPTKSKTYDGTALTFGAEEIDIAWTAPRSEGAAGTVMPDGEAFAFSNFASITEAGQTAATFAIADGTALMTDYEITVTPGATLTVTKSATEITVTAKNGEWTYDGATHTLHEYEAANLDTLIAGDELEVTFDEASAVTTPVDGQVPNTITGVRVIRGGTDDVSSNYTLAWYPGTLTVKKRPVTLKSKDASKVYDGTPLVKHEVEVGGDGFVGDDGASYEFTGMQTDKGKSKNAFTYTLNEGTNAAYYDITPTEGELEVFAADIGEAEDGDWQVVLGPALTYTGIAQVQTLASVTLDGLVVDHSIDGNQQTDAGEYEMTLIGQGNFTGKKKVAWSIAPKALTLTAGSGTKVYDGAALTVGTVTADGFVANETATFVCTGSQLDVGSSENAVGTITWTAAKASNYSVTKNPGTLAVTARPVVVKSKNISKPYDGTPLTLTAADISESYTGGAAGVRALPEGESFVYSGFASRTEAGQTSATFSIAAGANTKLSNYAITPAYGTITVTKSATEIGVTAASETWTYDGEVHSNRTWTATNLDTLQAGDELVVTFDDSSVVTTPRDGVAQDGVVENAITSVRVIRGGVENVTANYTVTPYPGVLKVVKRPVTVTVVGHVATNVYDSVEHAVSGYEISTSDELYDIAADTSFTGADTVSRTDVGSADMGLSASDFENGNENFTVTYAVTDGRLVIEAADITVGDGADFVLSLGANPKYNGTVQSVPVTAVTYKGLPVTYTLAGEVATHAGTYTLTVKANGNFTGERSTTWQVLKRQVVLTSVGAFKIYDGTPLRNDTVNVSGDGFIGAEGAAYAVTGAQTAVGTSKNAFTYTLNAGTLAGDYDISTVFGDLVVARASLPSTDDPDPVDPGVDPDDPEQREDPDVRFSAFDYVGVYDGEAHTIDTNALKAAYADKFLGNVPSFSYATTSNGVYQADVFAFADAIVTSFWYKVSAANFDDIVHPCKVAITNRAVTLTSASQEWTYDGAAHSAEEVTIGGDGFVAGEGVITNEFATITNVGTTPNAFSYAFASGTKAENYVVTCVTGTLSVVKAALPPGEDPDPIDPGVDPEDPEQREDPDVRFSAFDYVGVYDGEAHTIDTKALKAAYETAFGESVTIGYMDDASGAAGVRALPPIVRDAVVTSFWYKVSAANFDDIVHPCKVAITNRAVTVTVVGHSIAPFYDTTEKTVSGYDISTEDELYDVATMTTFSGTAVAKRTDVGTTSMGLAAGQFSNTNPNFAVTYDITDGGVTIVQRAIADDEANWDIRFGMNPVYDGTEKSAPITQVCYVKPDGNLDYIPYELSGNVATNAGNYKVKIIGKGNYSGSVEKDWAIMPRNVTLTSGTGTWMYDGSVHSNAEVVVSGDGFAAGEGVTCTGFTNLLNVADAPTPIENTFDIVLNSGTLAGNYEFHKSYGTVQMTKRDITLTAPALSKPYDGGPLTFVTGNVVVSGSGYAPGESFTLGNFASITDAGQVAATFTVADGTAKLANYEVTITPGVKLTVTKSATEISVTAASETWTYDGEDHSNRTWTAVNDSALQAGDELVVTFDPASVVRLPTDGAAGDGVEENTITSVKVIRNGTEDVTANYTLGAYPGELKVVKRPVTLTSASAGKTYDGTALVVHNVTVGGDGFVEGEGATYSYSGTQMDVGSSANAFTYTLRDGTFADNYAITKIEGTLTVTAADISVEGDADDWNVVLGTAPTYNGIEQIQTVVSATYKGLALDYSVSGNAATDAGNYTLTLTGHGNFTGVKEIPWTLGRRGLSLVVGGATKVYDGTPLTCGVVTVDGFVVGEGATFACDGTLTDVGESTNHVAEIVWSEGTKAGNYAVTETPGILTVTPRPVTVKSANISKPYDGNPLALTAWDISESYTGGAAGIRALPEGESFVYSDFASRTEAGQTSGTFSIAAGANTKLANYVITPGYGTITIAKSATEIGVTAASETWTYDGLTHSNRTYQATNLEVLQEGDELEVIFDEASVVMSATDGAAADGKVANVITSVKVIRDGTEDVTENYTVTAYPGELQVVKRAVTVSVKGKTLAATYDGTEKSVAGYDATTTDTIYDIASMTTFGGVASAKRTEAGKTVMGLAAAAFANTDANFDVTYAVTDGGVTISAADITAGTDGDFVIELGPNPKYNGTIQEIQVVGVSYKGLPVTYSLTGEKATRAGTYTLTVTANGSFTGERSTTWKILKRTVTFTSGDAAKTYDGTALTSPSVALGGDGFIGSDGYTITGNASLTDAGTCPNSFTYALKAGTLAGDYDITTTFGTLTVAKRPVTLQTASKEKPYDGFPLEVLASDITASGSGYAPGECFEYYDRASITEVGETEATFSYRDSATAKVANYEVTVIGGKTLKVTVGTDQISVTADSAVWAYDGEAHRLASWTIVNADKLLAGDEFAITISEASVVKTPEDGSDGNGIVSNAFASVKIVETATGNDKTRNYNLFVYEGTLQMTNRIIRSDEISVNSEEFSEKIEKTYDGKATNVTVTAELLQPETVTYYGDEDCLTAPGGAGDAGTMFTDAGTNEVWYVVSARYYEPYTGKVEIVILPRPVTFTSPTKAKPYDATALTFDADEIEMALTAPRGEGAAGTVLPEDESFAFSDFASITDAGRVGATFAYAAGANTKLANYEVTVVKGTLTVNASADEITVTANDGEWRYDGEAHSNYTYTVENGDVLESGDELVVTFAPESFVTNPDDGAAHDGVVPNTITAVKVMRGETDVTPNYSVVYYPGALTMKNALVTAADLEVAAADFTYDGMSHSTLVTPGELLTSPVSVTYAATADGPYYVDPMAVAVRDAGTYSLHYRVSAPYYDTYSGTATVKINPREVTLVSAGAEKVYDGTVLRKNAVTVKSGSAGFVSGEGCSPTCLGSQTDVGACENLFTYDLTGGAKSGNYTIKKEYGWLRVTPASLDAGAIGAAAGYAGPYDGEGHSLTVDAGVSGAQVSYSLVWGDESSYTNEIPVFTNAMQAATNVYFKILAPNYEVAYGTGTVWITTVAVEIPTIASKVYTGSKQMADVPASSLYTVRSNSGGTTAGSYNVLLQLADTKNYTWSDGSTGTKIVKFLITQAENAWTVEPAITGWKQGEAPSEPVGSARYGTVDVTYSGTTTDGETVTDSLSVSKPGIYTAHFAVEATTSYAGLSADVMFTVGASESGGIEPASFKVTNFLGAYDGVEHTISVAISGGDGSFKVSYSTSKEGPWSEIAPGFKAVGSWTVWYRITSPNYATQVGSGSVTIVEGGDERDYVDVPQGGYLPVARIPYAWFRAQPGVAEKFGTDWDKVAYMKTGKRDSDGNEMMVWQDYVAGTDPTNLASRLTAYIRMEKEVPIVTWKPALNGEGVKVGERIYRILGKKELTDPVWTKDIDEKAGVYRFFKVTVEVGK